jgi:tetratricopeptide (TPR) repeat protein
MSQPRNRWLINTVLILAILAFIGVSLIPIIGQINTNSQPSSQSAASANNNASGNEKTKLQDEIRGLELVLQREPENQTALKGLLERRLQLVAQGTGEVKDVIDPLEKLAKLNPAQSQYGILLGQAKQQMGDKDGAAEAFRTALKNKPGDLQALQAMVSLLVSQKRPEAAIGLLQETLTQAPQINKITPDSVDIIAVQILLADVHGSQKRYSQANDVYDNAIKSAPKDFRPLLAKALLLKDQGKLDEAKPLFEKAKSIAPANAKDEIDRQAIASPTPKPESTSTSESPPTPTPTSTASP